MRDSTSKPENAVVTDIREAATGVKSVSLRGVEDERREKDQVTAPDMSEVLAAADKLSEADLDEAGDNARVETDVHPLFMAKLNSQDI